MEWQKRLKPQQHPQSPSIRHTRHIFTNTRTHLSTPLRLLGGLAANRARSMVGTQSGPVVCGFVYVV